MGHTNKAIKQDFRTRKDEEYGTLFVKVMSKDANVIVQLLNTSDKPVRTEPIQENGYAEFYYLKPSDYYLRCFIDRNDDGIWTTGHYDSGTAPEEVFYFPQAIPVKAQWENKQDWDIRAVPAMKQKPAKITKQKPDKSKDIKARNKERDAAMERESRKRGGNSR